MIRRLIENLVSCKCYVTSRFYTTHTRFHYLVYLIYREFYDRPNSLYLLCESTFFLYPFTVIPTGSRLWTLYRSLYKGLIFTWSNRERLITWFLCLEVNLIWNSYLGCTWSLYIFTDSTPNFLWLVLKICLLL